MLINVGVRGMNKVPASCVAVRLEEGGFWLGWWSNRGFFWGEGRFNGWLSAPSAAEAAALLPVSWYRLAILAKFCRADPEPDPPPAPSAPPPPVLLGMMMRSSIWRRLPPPALGSSDIWIESLPAAAARSSTKDLSPCKHKG